ncbi:MAG: glycosyltransferase family 2 protein [Dysgonamonadaceae bacterium]|jgi:glycosyltransferase involved in cell wall biosynthesis|nr:glycosyltransferase family 2 protein [Dysgonamonadaceae bacterium]
MTSVPTNPLISVIIPVRNASKYIGEAIDSVQCQPVNANIEIIVVDDDSSDDSGHIAQKMGCKVFRIPHSGPIKARNTGLENARGNFILFADADDVLRIDALSVMYNELISDQRLQVVLAMRKDFISPDYAGNGQNPEPARPDPYFGAIAGCALMRREVFAITGKFDESLNMSGDAMAWLLELQSKAVKTKKIQYIAVNRRIHSSNMGKTNKEQEYKDYLKILLRKSNMRK